MKKILAATIATTVVAGVSAVHAAPFNGYSIGLNSGVNIARTKSSNLAAPLSSLGISGKSSTKTAGLFGMQFAYEASKSNSLYWGLGLDLNLYAGGKNKHTICENKNFVHGGVQYSNYTLNYENKQKWSSNLDFRLGYNFCTQAILYGLVGIKLYGDQTKVFHSYKFNANAAGVITRGAEKLAVKKKRTRLSPVFGVGAAYKVTNNVSLGSEYRYNLPVSKRYRGHGGREVIKLKTGGSHAIMAKVTYHF